MNNYENIRDYITAKAGEIPEEDWVLYEENLVASEAKKGDVILQYGEPCLTIWHMTRGAVRKTEMNNGISNTTHFYTAPMVFTVLQSALNRSPSELSIICEEDCSFLELPYDKIQVLFDRSHYAERIGRRIVEDEFLDEFEMRRMFLKMDALERYEYMEKHRADVLNRFQLKDVATFLGITPESLSRLRKTRFSN